MTKRPDPMDQVWQASLPPWPTLEEDPRTDHGVFAVQRVVRRSPRTGRARPFQLLHMPDWVNVVALTADDEIVLVEQFRHGVGHSTLEIPGGAVEAGEDPGAAAARELVEETGFAGAPAVRLGTVTPNPALQTNRCTTWLIPGASLVAEPDPDDGEHLRTVLVPRRSLPERVERGEIDHALVIAAFYWLDARGTITTP